jgi:tetratricopeptide (TPR) repeat protein
VPQQLNQAIANPHRELMPVIHAHQNQEDLFNATQLVFLAAKSEGAANRERARAFRRALDIQERLVAAYPDREPLRLDLARFCRQAAAHASKLSSYGDAVRWYSRAITLEKQLLEQFPKFASVGEALTANQGDLAWLQAACPDPEFHDGKTGVLHATEACKRLGKDDATYLDTLAAACARAGQFDDAVVHVKKALTAVGENQKTKIEARLRLYEAKKAFHEPEGKFPSRVHR